MSRITRDQNTLCCFSPPVMLATLAIELGLAAYALIRYRLSPIVRAAVAMFILLAVFQAAEYSVCRGIGSAEFASRIGFVAITLLPPLGWHMFYILTGRRPGKSVIAAYLTGALFIGYFLLSRGVFVGNMCLGNYVIFQLSPITAWIYGLYYYGWLLAAMLFGYRYITSASNTRTRRAVTGLMFGYLTFVAPTTAVNFLLPHTLRAIPSIMCGFAVALALILGLVVLPAAARPRSGSKRARH